jgi:hypothetical protein
VLADAGYWTNNAIEALAAEGLQPLVAPDADRRKEPRPGRRGGLYDFMRRVLATERGGELYRRRQTTIEPVFGAARESSRRPRLTPGLYTKPADATDLCATASTGEREQDQPDARRCS